MPYNLEAIDEESLAQSVPIIVQNAVVTSNFLFEVGPPASFGYSVHPRWRNSESTETPNISQPFCRKVETKLLNSTISVGQTKVKSRS